MVNLIMEGIGALVGTFGFSLLFGLKREKIWVATAGGFFAWCIYAIMNLLVPNDLFICNFMPALFGTAYSQVMARVTKSPATMYIFTSLIVLVPGGKLYYSMRNIILENTDEGIDLLLDTFEIAAALASGIVIVMASIKIIYYFLQNKRRRIKK